MLTRRLAVGGAAGLVLAGSAAVAFVATQPHGDRIRTVALPIPPLPPLPPLFQAPPQPAPPSTTHPATPNCPSVRNPFLPTSVSIPGIADGIPVLALRRNADGSPGTPPLSKSGKHEMAFDLGSGIRPGDRRGNALLNAHTWPDGSALGNKLLAGLHLGDPLLVQGRSGGICYHVTGRVEVPATAQHSGYFDTSGPPRIAIAVCSGRRLGPGRWTTRTLWFASPTQPPAPAAPAPKRTDPASDKSGLGLGGLGLSRR